jgi:hypothetical protein
LRSLIGGSWCIPKKIFFGTGLAAWFRLKFRQTERAQLT